MAGKIYKAGIRFNSESFKYMSFIFNEEDTICTIDANVIDPRSGEALTIRGTISHWVPVEDELQTAGTSNTRTTKKAAKESK